MASSMAPTALGGNNFFPLASIAGTTGSAPNVFKPALRYSSLSYVAFNPFGNFNNYVLGRLNDNIEAIGGRFYSMKSYNRAALEYNKRAMPDMIHRLASQAKKPVWKNDYDPEQPTSKYEAFVDPWHCATGLLQLYSYRRCI